MIAKIVRIGTVADQDSFRRHDTMAMTPSQRVICLMKLRDSQFRAVARPIKGSGVFACRDLPFCRKK